VKRFLSLDNADFGSLFRNFEVATFRLETLQLYNVDYEREPFQDFLAGKERYTHPRQQQWVDGIRANLTAGKTMSRVHVIEEPVSDYVRFEITWPYQDSLRAGEEIRVLPVKRGEWPPGVLDFDYWLFDSVVGYRMYYDPDGSFSSADLIGDKKEVARLEQCRLEAIAGSIPLSDYWPTKSD
jgi:hypothetical protein